MLCLTLLLVAVGSYVARAAPSAGSAKQPKAIVILADGCRWDYPERNAGQYPGLERLAREGVRAEHVVPVYPANSYPNWYSLVTGLYAESHGFVENHMYDELYDDLFLMTPDESASVPHWWQGAEPIWVSAVRNELRVGMWWWDGCQVEIRGVRPTQCLQYRPSVTPAEVQDAFLTAVDKLESGELDLAMVYVEMVDHAGHVYGPESAEREKAFRDLDSALQALQEAASSKIPDLSIVVLSDHGMTDQTNFTDIDISRAVDLKDIKYMVYAGAGAGLIPETGRTEKLYQDLKNARFPGLRVYKKEDIPERYHIKHNRLTPPIVLMADKGYLIQSIDVPAKSTTSRGRSRGGHGWDPKQEKDMLAMFYAKGPGLKTGYLSPPIENVDQYNLMCSRLNIQPLPNNGSWARIQGMLERQSSSPNSGPEVQGRSWTNVGLFFLTSLYVAAPSLF